MASFVTKCTGIDNWDSSVPDTVEVWIRDKKAFVEHGTCKVINGDEIKNLTKYQAFKIAFTIAKNYFNFPYNKGNAYERYLQKLKER